MFAGLNSKKKFTNTNCQFLFFFKVNSKLFFKGSNPHEFYDNNAEKLFRFVAPKIAVPLSLRLVWGIEHVHSLGHFEFQKLTKLSTDLKFQLKTLEQIKELANDMTRFRQLSFIQHKDRFWPER